MLVARQSIFLKVLYSKKKHILQLMLTLIMFISFFYLSFSFYIDTRNSMIVDRQGEEPLMTYWGRLQADRMDQSIVDDYETLETNLKGELFAFIPIGILGKPVEAAFILGSVAQPNDYQVIGYELDESRIRIEVDNRGKNGDPLLNPIGSSKWFSNRKIALIFPAGMLLDFPFPADTSLDFYLLYFINQKSLDRSIFRIDRTIREELGKIVQFLDRWEIKYSSIPTFEKLEKEFEEVSLQFGSMFLLVNFLVWMMFHIQLGIQTSKLKKEIDQTLELLNLRGLNRNDVGMAFWIGIGGLEAGSALTVWIAMTFGSDVFVSGEALLFILVLLIGGKVIWYVSGTLSNDWMKYFVILALLLNLAFMLVENATIGDVQYTGSFLLILLLGILLYFLDHVLATLSIHLMTAINRKNPPRLLFQRIALFNMGRTNFVNELRKLWLAFFLVFFVLGFTIASATIQETNWGEITYEVQGKSFSDFVLWKQSLPLQDRQKVSGIGFIAVERSIGKGLTVGVVDEEFTKLTPGATEISENLIGTTLPLAGSSELFKTEGFQIGDRFRGTINDSDVVFQLVADFDYLVPFHYRHLNMLDAYLHYESLQHMGLNLSEIPVKYIAMGRVSEELQESMRNQFFQSKKISFDIAAPNEISFLLNRYESIYPIILLIFAYIGIFQPLVWIGILEKQEQFKRKLGNRGIRKSNMKSWGFYAIVNLAILFTLDLFFILASISLLSHDQRRYYLSLPLEVLRIFFVVNLEIMGMFVLSWIPISLSRAD